MNNETPKRRGRPPKTAAVVQQPVASEVPKRRGRPPKAKVEQTAVATKPALTEQKRRGRPPKATLNQTENKTAVTPAKKRGRPAKQKADDNKKVVAKNETKPATVKRGRPKKVLDTGKKDKVVSATLEKRSVAKPKKAVSKQANTTVVKPGQMPTIGVVSLGCDKNRVDTENMLTFLKAAGYKFTNNPEKADAIIVNTCCFIRSAREESEDAIAEMAEYKKRGTCKKLIVTGCLPQYDMKSLQNEFPEADALIGINEYKDIVKIVDSLFNIGKKVRLNTSPMCVDYAPNRLTTTPQHLAYLKIADGCNNFCSFCTIPYIRGRYRSRNIESLVEEARSLAAHGTKELILVAQDTTRYGIDLYGEPKLVELLRRLSEIKNLSWIRLLYCYPEMVSDELIEEIANNPKICKYIDVPFQHVSDPILKRMNRHCTNEQTIALIKKLKAQKEFIAIRTTYMVGFPGETKQDFKALYNFIKNNKLSNVGFFAYSREAGTEAFDMPDQVDESVKNKRLVKLVRLQKKIHSRVAAKNHVGKVYDVICEGFDSARRMYVGRNQYQAPEIDTNIYFVSREPIMVGEIYKVKVKKLVGYDLEGVKL